MSKTLFAQLYKAKAFALAAKILHFDLGSDFLQKKMVCTPPPNDSTDLKKSRSVLENVVYLMKDAELIKELLGLLFLTSAEMKTAHQQPHI